MTEGKQRHWCLTAFLVVAITLNSLVALMYLFWGFLLASMGAAVVDVVVVSLLLPLGIVGFNIVCLVALYQWKKWGFYGAVASGLLWFVVTLAIGFPIVPAVIGLVGFAVLYGVLQIGGDKKGWTQLE